MRPRKPVVWFDGQMHRVNGYGHWWGGGDGAFVVCGTPCGLSVPVAVPEDGVLADAGALGRVTCPKCLEIARQP